MAVRTSTGFRNKQLGINPEKVTNGTFDTVTTGWTASDASLSVADTALRVTETGSANPGWAYQDITTKVGHLYKVTFSFKKGTADSGKFMIGITTDEDSIYDSGALTDATLTAYTTYFVATATTTRLTCESTDATATEYSDFDTISVVSEARSLQDVFNGGEIRIYSGVQPSSADAAPTGTLLCTIKKDGTDGISFDDAASGVITKAAAETWQGTVPAGVNGTAGWARLMHADDSLALSTTDERIDMSVATSGAQLNFSSTTFAAGAVQTVTTFAITLPAQ